MTEIMTTFGIEYAANWLSVLMIFVSVCAILTSFVTEGLKSIPRLNKSPSKLLVYIVALVLTPPVFCALMAWMEQPIEWFMVFGSFLASFVVAKVSMSGWDDVTELCERLFKR